MSNLIDELELTIWSSSALRTNRKSVDDGTTVYVNGKEGSAEVDFKKDGDIVALIDSDMVHSWECFPNYEDVRACGRKICNMLT